MERPDIKSSTRIGCCEHLYGQQRNGRESIEASMQAYLGLYWSIEQVYRIHSFTGDMVQLRETKSRIG